MHSLLGNEGKNNVFSANKQSDELHTAVSVAFSYLLQCRVKTGGKLLLMDHIPTFGSRLHWKELIGYFKDVSPKHVILTSLEYYPIYIYRR